MRIEDHFEAELLHLLDGLRRFVRQPDLNIGLAVAREFQFFSARLRALVLQSVDHRGDRRMKLGAQLLLELFFRQLSHRNGLAPRSVLACIKVEGQDPLSLHRYAGKFRWFESPLLRRLDSGVAEYRMAADNLRVDHLATFVDRDLDLNRAFCPCGFCYRWVSRLNFLCGAALQDTAGNRDPPGIIRNLRGLYCWRRLLNTQSWLIGERDGRRRRRRRRRWRCRRRRDPAA